MSITLDEEENMEEDFQTVPLEYEHWNTEEIPDRHLCIDEHSLLHGLHSTLPIMKKYAEILLRYKQLFIKGNIFIGEWGIFGAEVFLHYGQFFVKWQLHYRSS